MLWDALAVLVALAVFHNISERACRNFKLDDDDDRAASALFAMLPITNGLLAAILFTMLLQGGTIVPFWR